MSVVMCVCVHTYVYTHICVYLYIHTWIHTHTEMEDLLDSSGSHRYFWPKENNIPYQGYCFYTQSPRDIEFKGFQFSFWLWNYRTLNWLQRIKLLAYNQGSNPFLITLERPWRDWDRGRVDQIPYKVSLISVWGEQWRRAPGRQGVTLAQFRHGLSNTPPRPLPPYIVTWKCRFS